MSLRYGLIGAGMMGGEHIRNIALLEDAAVAALVEPDAEMRAAALALAPGARTFETLEAMIAADLCDAYLIAAPNDLHHDLLRRALAGAKPILCEKPLATTAEGCADLIRLARGGPPVWVAMEYRYMPPVALLIEEARAGTAGAPRMMAIREHRFPFLPKVGDWNRFNARTGGTLVEKCCHFFDLMRFVLQADPIRVYASGGADVNHRDERYDGRVPDILDNAFVTVGFRGGQRAMLDLCMFAEGAYWQEEITLTGDLARLEAYVPGPARFTPNGRERAAEFAISDRAARIERRRAVEVDEAVLGAGDHHGSTFYQHRRFAKMAREGGAPEVGLVDGWWSVAMGEAAELSARTGRAVDLGEAAPPAP